MLIDRLEDIKKLLLENNKVLVSELKDRYNVSEVTIRKDLSSLVDAGFAKKFHGGAILNTKANVFEQTLDIPKNQDIITELACAEISDGDIIFLGSGTTCSVLAKKLSRFEKLTVVTNNISALNDLLLGVYKVYLIGGEVTTTDDVTLFSSDQKLDKYFENIFVNKAFTSASGVDINAGITVNSIISTYIYSHLQSMPCKWYMMCDKKKFDKISMYKVANLENIDCFITDKKHPKYAEVFAQKNINYISK